MAANVGKALQIQSEIGKLSERTDSDGSKLILGGIDGYIHPERFVELANKFRYTKYASYAIDDEQIIQDIIKQFQYSKRVIVVGRKESLDLYVEP